MTDQTDPSAEARTEPRTLTPTAHAQATPDRPAVVMATSGETVTYAELEARSNRIAHALRARGLGVGDHIAILMENNRRYFDVAWAAQRSGLHYTPINRHLRPGEVQYILDDCGAGALFASEAMADVVAGLDLGRVPVLVAADGSLPGFEPLDRFVDGQPDTRLDDECEGREMIYSSGTTGRPKGVRKELPATPLGDPTSPPVQIAQGLYALGAQDAVYLSPAPLYHAAPLVYSMSLHRLGATVVVMEQFDPLQCLELIERHRITLAQFVPTMFVRLLRLPAEDRERFDLSSLTFVVHAAAPCPVPIKHQMIEWWGPIIHEYYAGTEDIGSTFISAQEWLAHPGSVGRPASPAHIVGEDGEELGPHESGIVYFEGSGRSFEYHNDPEKTASIEHPKGWKTIGDIGYLDEDGYLYLTDRQAHMIISGGVNIYPQEAENVLASHPAVLDVAVIGVPDDEMGEAVKAVVQPVDPSAAGPALAEQLLAHCRAELATYKCPRSVDFVDELPRDPNGKLYKRRLRERYWQGHDSLVR